MSGLRPEFVWCGEAYYVKSTIPLLRKCTKDTGLDGVYNGPFSFSGEYMLSGFWGGHMKTRKIFAAKLHRD